jgi:hypothetical protein
MAAFAIAAVVSINALIDRTYYGTAGQGNYPVAAVEGAWYSARHAQTGPRVTAIRVLTDGHGRLILSPSRQDALVYGYSQLFCYEPLFGYNLERFPVETLHPGPALSSNAGILNVKNPACYVFPEANACAPGDQFPVSRISDAQAFLDYKSFPFVKPLWARLADWLSLLMAFSTAIAMFVGVAQFGLQDLPMKLGWVGALGRTIWFWTTRTCKKGVRRTRRTNGQVLRAAVMSRPLISNSSRTGKDPTESALPPSGQVNPDDSASS